MTNTNQPKNPEKMRTYLFTSKSTIKANSKSEAKIIFANCSFDFASNAECEDITPKIKHSDELQYYEEGINYRYSQIPKEDTEEYTVSEYGLELFGQNAIHIRYHSTDTDIWFIYVGQANEGILKCVFKD